MPDKKYLFLLLSMSVVLALFLSACGGTATPVVEDTAPPEEADELVILTAGWLDPVDSWNPYSSVAIWTHGDFVYDTLVAKASTPSCDAVPRLAESWERSEDGLTWTVNLADGITYSDGTPFDAYSAVEFIEWFSASPDLKFWFSTSSVFASAEALDENTFQVTTEIPDSGFIEATSKFWYQLPLHIWKDVPDDEFYTFDAFPPVGTGPYTVTEWDPGSHLIYDARPDYFRGKPPIDRIVFRFYSNVDALLAALLSGEIDVSFTRMPPETYDIMVADPNITVDEIINSNKYILTFNLSDAGVKHPAVEDLAVREAIDYALDRQQLIDVALRGHGALCPTNWACAPTMADQINPDLVVTPYDPDIANQILDDAGYLDSDGDGIRETADGQPLEFRLFFQLEDVAQLTIADMLSGWLGEIGIAIEVEALELGEVTQGIMVGRDFDMFIYNMYTDIDAGGHMDYTDSCWSAGAGSGGRNFPGWCNEEYDNLVNEYRFAADDEAGLEAIFEAQAMLNQIKPYITLIGINEIQAFRNDRFEFPLGNCHETGGGMLSYEGFMNVVVK